MFGSRIPFIANIPQNDLVIVLCTWAFSQVTGIQRGVMPISLTHSPYCCNAFDYKPNHQFITDNVYVVSIGARPRLFPRIREWVARLSEC